MKLVEFVPPTPHPLWTLCPQMGVTDVVVKVHPDLTGLPDPWRFGTLSGIVSRLADAGLTVVGLEGDPFDMSPVKEFGTDGDRGPAAEARREETLDHYRELLESMGRLGIPLLCYNFMPGTGWARTGVREGRGGAKAACFSLAETPAEPLRLSADQVWENYETFVRSVLPAAEAAGVRMGLHPDDPCLPALGGCARIFGSVEACDRAYALHPAPANAVTFCQANFKLMGADLEAAARHFGDRIAYVHVRDVAGSRENFVELFHDEGTTDHFALFRVYREIGLDVPLRGDHVPEMAFDRVLAPGSVPGYGTLGRLFANGYLKALLAGTGPSPRRWGG